LHRRLDVEPEPFLERDEPACVAGGALPPATVDDDRADEQVGRVRTEADRRLAASRELPTAPGNQRAMASS
jgi:hypothetical protein